MDGTRTRATSASELTNRRSISTEDFSLQSQFEEVATRLAQAPASKLDLPISHWAMASDRRLPFALLNYTVREIATASFANLIATPGVGYKKFAGLVMLLNRILSADEPTPAVIESIELYQDDFQPDLVSQVMWSEWQETVRQRQLQDETLGRLVPSLRMLPTEMWTKPLGDYLRYTIDELRSLKAHGEKRVTAVLEVFHIVHGLLGSSSRSTRVAVQLMPAFVPPIEQWLYGVLSSDEPPTAQDIRQHLILPLLNQIERDAGETVHRLAAGRLGVEAFPEGVRDQSLELGVTRARIYQLLETCGQVMLVRWPEGRWMLKLLIQKAQSHARESEALDLLESLEWLLYRERRPQAVAEPAIA